MSNTAILIGLVGPPRCGKNIVTDIICQYYQAVHLSISDPMKCEAHRIANRIFREEEKDTPQKILSGKTPRDLYIHLGDIDNFVPNYWIDETIKLISPRAGARYVIESIGKQFQWNRILESAIVPRMHLIEIRRKGCVWDSRTPIKDYKHVWVIENDWDIRHLEAKTKELMDHILSIDDMRMSGATWQFLKEQEVENKKL